MFVFTETGRRKAEHYNSWGTTNNYDADELIALTYGADFVEKEA